MSADEIRWLAESRVLDNFCGKELLDGEPCTECFDHYGRTCQDKGAIKSALLAYAAMVERCEERIEELGKCDNYKKNNGVCPAARGEEVNLNNCLDESCPNGSVIKELKEILKKGKTDERK